MPTQTFFNLSDEKRIRIINAATEEFATYCFDQASIARIIKNAEIPRGSFYQYFENLKDVYKFILNLAGEQKITYFRKNVPQFEGAGFNFFQTLRDLCIAGLQFAEENPKLLAIGNNFLKETNKALQEEVMGEQLPKAENIYTLMIKKGIELGQINPHIDPLLANHFLGVWSRSLGEYYVAELKNRADDQFLNRMDQMLDLLANGLGIHSALGGEPLDDLTRR